MIIFFWPKNSHHQEISLKMVNFRQNEGKIVMETYMQIIQIPVSKISHTIYVAQSVLTKKLQLLFFA